MQDERDKVNGIVVVPEQSEKYLNQRQFEDYQSFRKQVIKWLHTLGTDPESPLLQVQDGAIVPIACSEHQSEIVRRFQTGLRTRQRLKSDPVTHSDP